MALMKRATSTSTERDLCGAIRRLFLKSSYETKINAIFPVFSTLKLDLHQFKCNGLMAPDWRIYATAVSILSFQDFWLLSS